MKELYRGIWANHLEEDQHLPVGGSICSDELSNRLILNFQNLPGLTKIMTHTPESFKQIYQENKTPVIAWLKEINAKIDPYLFFLTNNIQRTIQSSLEVNTSQAPNIFDRIQKFDDNNSSKLTDLIGLSMCAEQAAVGQYILQKILSCEFSSAYVSGVTANSKDGEITGHSFIQLENSQLETYIFDIARPIPPHNLPRVLLTNIPFNYNQLKDREKLLINSKQTIYEGELYFGVGNDREF